jgi:hypothetical protein
MVLDVAEGTKGFSPENKGGKLVGLRYAIEVLVVN